MSSGNLQFHITLASLPAGRGGSPGAGVSLIYNSKLWDPSSVVTPSGVPVFLKTSPEGNWRYSYDYNLQVIDKRNEYYAPYGGGPGTCTSAASNNEGSLLVKVRMRFPDGGQHEFRPVMRSGVYYNQEGYYNVEPNGRTWYCRSESPYFPNDYVLTSTLPTYATATYYSTDGTYLRLDIGFTAPDGSGLRKQFWTLSFPDGGRVTTDPYPTAGTQGTQHIYDRNNNHVEIASVTSNSLPATRLADDLGRSIIVEGADANGEAHVRATGFGGTPLVWTVRSKTITVNKTYYPGAGYSPQTMSTSLGVIESITLPAEAGGLAYTFEYNAGTASPSVGWGEVSAVTLPSGARVAYTYKQDNANNLGPWDVVQNHPTFKDLSYALEYDGASPQTTETWQYTFTFIGTGSTATSSSVTAPDGGISSSVFINDPPHWDHALTLMSETPDGTRVERRWMANTPYAAGVIPEPPANPYVKTEYTSIRNAGGDLVKTAVKDYSYDKNGNVLEVREYDWVNYGDVSRDAGGWPTGVPQSAVLKRVSKKAYYNQTPDASAAPTFSAYAYHLAGSPRLRNAVMSTEVGDGAQTLSRVEFTYDDPSNTGNMTLQRSWDSTKGPLLTPQPDATRLNATNSVSVSKEYDDNTNDPALRYGNVTLAVDANGNRAKYTYGAVTGPGGTTFTGLYPTGVVAAEGTSVQRTTSSVYDFWTGLVTKVTDDDNQVSASTTYDGLGRPTLVEEADDEKDSNNVSLERRTVTEYSDALRRVIVRSDLKATSDGKLVSVRHYDQLGRLRLSRTLEDPSTEAADNEYTGIKVQYRYLADRASLSSYQLVSNPYRAARSSDAGSEATMGWSLKTLDRGGRLVRVKTFDGATLPAPFATGTPNGSSSGAVDTAYDAETTTVTDQDLKKRKSVVDALGRLVEVYEAPGVTNYNFLTGYTYDALGNLTMVTQGVQTRSFVYSSLSRLTSATNPEVCRQEQSQCVPVPVTYQYDANGNLKQKVDARLLPGTQTHVEVTYDYDELSRVKSRTYNDDTPDIAYTYDSQALPAGAPDFDRGLSAGRLVAMTYGGGTLGNYTGLYDALGRPKLSRQRTDTGTTEGVQTYEMAYGYDLAGNLKSETYPSGREVTTEYDAAGRVAGVKNQATGQYYAGGDPGVTNNPNVIAYAAHDSVAAMRLGNGLWEHTNFNRRLQPEQIGLGTASTNSDMLQLDYTYGTDDSHNNGNLRTQRIRVAGSLDVTQSYTYDELNRLSTAQEAGSQGWTQNFTYDRCGNRSFAAGTTFPNYSQGLTDPAGNPIIDPANNRIKTSEPGQGNFIYDAAGNLTRSMVTAQTYHDLTYDAENRQVKADGGAAAGGTDYSYDGDSRRVRKMKGTAVTVYVYDVSGRMVAEYGNSAPIMNGTRYVTSDLLGSPRVITGSDVQAKERHDYMPFGEETLASYGGRGGVQGYGADLLRQKFTGYERDNETGLDYAQARYYSATQGRFTSVDPALGSMEVTNPQSFNRYTYALNNPLAFVDPDGQEPLKVLTWDKLTDEQKRLFQTYVQKNYAEELKNPLFTAENLWNSSAAVANGDAAAGPNSRLLDQSQLTTFAGDTSMLEARGVINQVASITEINGDTPEHEFRIIGELVNNTTAVKAIEKAFDGGGIFGNILGSISKGHEPYTVSRREQGPNGEPNGQVSRIPNGTGVDVDVDYRAYKRRDHLTRANSDIRADDPAKNTTHYRRHIQRYGPIPVLQPVRP